MQEIKDILSEWNALEMPAGANERIRLALNNEFNTRNKEQHCNRTHGWRTAVSGIAAVVLVGSITWGVIKNSSTLGAASSPSSVVSDWFEAVQAKDADKAVSYLDFRGISKAKLVSEYKSAFKTDHFTKLKIESVKKISPSKVKVKALITDMYVMTGEEKGIKYGELDEWDLTLVKIHGEWKIYVDASPHAPVTARVLKHVY